MLGMTRTVAGTTTINWYACIVLYSCSRRGLVWPADIARLEEFQIEGAVAGSSDEKLSCSSVRGKPRLILQSRRSLYPRRSTPRGN